MLFIGICGASGSGKSTLAEELATMVNKSILIINQDAYYKDHPDLSFEERCLLNYDEPSIFDHDQLLEDVQNLLEGRRVSKKRYDYSHHCRADVPGEYLEPHDVIIVEDIIDSGITLAWLVDELKRRGAASVEIFALLEKPARRKVNVDVKYKGREIPDEFVVGFGLDYDEYYRNLDSIAVLKPSVYEGGQA